MLACTGLDSFSSPSGLSRSMIRFARGSKSSLRSSPRKYSYFNADVSAHIHAPNRCSSLVFLVPLCPFFLILPASHTQHPFSRTKAIKAHSNYSSIRLGCLLSRLFMPLWDKPQAIGSRASRILNRVKPSRHIFPAPLIGNLGQLSHEGARGYCHCAGGAGGAGSKNKNYREFTLLSGIFSHKRKIWSSAF